MDRGSKMLKLCAEVPQKIGIEYAIIEVLELNSLHLLKKRELKIAADLNLWEVTLPNKNTYQALIISTGEKGAMEKLLKELIRYRDLRKQYKHLTTSHESTQTEPELLERLTTPPIEQHIEKPAEEPLTQHRFTDVAMSSSMDITEPITPLLPIIFMKTNENPADVSHLDPTDNKEQQEEVPTIESLDVPSSSQDNVYHIMEFSTAATEVKGLEEEEQTFESLDVPSAPQDDVYHIVESTTMTTGDVKGPEEEIPTSRSLNVPTSLQDTVFYMENIPTTSSDMRTEEEVPSVSSLAGPSSVQGREDSDSDVNVTEEEGLKPKSSKRKKHHCKYCMKLIGNFSRHLLKMHLLEQDVQTYYNASSSSERLAKLRSIMAEGDSIYNKLHPKSPIVRRQSIKDKYSKTKCPECKLFISDKHVVNHLRKCKEDATYYSGTALRVKIDQDKIQLHQTLNDDMKTRIIPFMRNDSIRRLCTNDPSLILYGNKMCNRLKGERQEKTIRNHLRILGRVSEKTMELSSETISATADIFQPKHYNTFVNAIYSICGHGEAEGQEMAKPTTPHQYGPKMRDLSNYILTELRIQLEKGRDDEQKDLNEKIDIIQTWQKIYDWDFDKQVASLGRKQAERRTYERRQETPSMEDVQKLLKHIEDTLSDAEQKLKENFSYENYITVSKCLLLKLWIFNRRRVGEVDDMLLKNWLSQKEIDKSSDQFKALTITEQSYAGSFKRVVVMSKLRRPAALLVANKDLGRFDLMISLREKAKITSDNEYLFANNEKYIEGTAVMNEFALKCGAEKPHLLTGTRLRKQLAASLRYLNLTDEDLRLVAESMGHTEKTHLTKYRTHDPALHAGRMGKILMAIDDGTIAQYAGKTIDEIDSTVVIEELSEEPEGVDFIPQIEEQKESSSQSQSSLPMRPKIIKRLFDSESEEGTATEATHRGSTPGRKRAFSKRRPHKKSKVSNALKEAIKNKLKEEIKEKRCPSTARVLQVMGDLETEFPEIINSSPKKIKALVTNWSKQK